MPVGYLITVLVIGGCVALQFVPVARKGLFARLSFWGGLLVNEQPHWTALFLVAATGLALSEGDITSTVGWIPVGLAVLIVAVLPVLLIRAFSSRVALRRAIAGFGDGAVERLAGDRSYLTTLIAPFAFGRTRVQRTGNVSYGPVPGKANRLDIYRPRNGEVTGPTLIYLHGGRFRIGGKRREAKAMLYRLAGKGWLTISANYRLNPEGRFPDFLIDLKRVIAWTRTAGLSFGADPERTFLVGGSAGAHISAMAALTPGHRRLQPGFEEVDTSVRGVIGLYGYYGPLALTEEQMKEGIGSSPRDHVGPGSPPFLLIDAGRDTVAPEPGGQDLATDLRTAGNPVALAELPGAQHSFDLLRSVRVENTIDAIEDFALWASRPRAA